MKRKPKTIFLVSCVKTKKKTRTPIPASTLYCSPWFKEAKEYVEARHARWFILSAKHHLLKPSRRIPLYNKTLLKMRAPKRREWAEHVFYQLRKICRPCDTVSILAGNRYREYLVPLIKAHGCRVKRPIPKTMGLVKQIMWLKRDNMRCRIRSSDS